MDALHHVNILHADIKPDNIMLTNSNGLKAKLIDFGMAYEDSEVIQGMVVQPVPYRYHLFPSCLLYCFHGLLYALFSYCTLTSNALISSFLVRAPEVLLGLPFSYGIDMWGMGCVLMYLYLEDNLFTFSSEYEMVRDTLEPHVQNQAKSSSFS